MSDLLLPGQIFAGRYRVESFLARGGFGAVYVAEQIETELRVALKVLFPHVIQASKDAAEKFKLEARVAGRVGSEQIVKVFDAGVDEATGMPFLAMELLQGENLEALVQRVGPLSGERVVSYLRQLASALDKSHDYRDREGVKRPIVHRDLKPENLFLCQRQSADPILKVLDFGIAKVLGESVQVSREVKGTPLFMAFEQASAGEITPQTDIWAFGLIAFFLLTGRHYWRSANAAEASISQLFGEILALPIEPPSLRCTELRIGVALPPAFDAWFLRVVNRTPSERFASAGECARALADAFSVPAEKPSMDLALEATVAAPFSACASAPRVVVTGASTDAPLVGRTLPNASAARSRRTLLWGLALGLPALGLIVAWSSGSFSRVQRVAAEPPSAPVSSLASNPQSVTTVSVAAKETTPATSASAPVAASASASSRVTRSAALATSEKPRSTSGARATTPPAIPQRAASHTEAAPKNGADQYSDR
ncbi:MAG TPA: serine/threonine-protein kinase [Polyangiaceae bacterium]|jgi:serine/threonine-protein kinase